MKLTKNTAILILIICIAISYLQHLPFVNTDIQGVHSWRQSQTMWNIRNFVRHDNNILNPRINKFNGGQDNILRYEFPIMQWGIAQLQKVFGEDISIVRSSIFLIGAISVFAFFFIIYFIFKDWTTALLSAILFQYAPVFYLYTINPIPDNLALAFGMVYILFILKHSQSSKTSHLIIACLALMLSTLSKLPYLMFSVISIYFFLKEVIKKKTLTSNEYKYALFHVVILLPAFSWYLWVIPGWTGNPVLTGQLNEVFVLSEYLHIAKYHATTMFPHILLSLPIWIVWVIGLFAYFYNWRHQKWMLVLIGITFLYLFLEFKPIGIVHDYYMLPFLPWLFFILAFGINSILKIKYSYIILGIICIWSSLYTAMKAEENWSIEKTYFNSDVFNYTDELKNIIPNHEHCIILNDVSGYIFSYRIDKMGYVFMDDYLPIEWIEDMVTNYNIKYMYSDSRPVDESIAFQKYIDTILLQKGSVKVIKLKNPADGT